MEERRNANDIKKKKCPSADNETADRKDTMAFHKMIKDIIIWSVSLPP